MVLLFAFLGIPYWCLPSTLSALVQIIRAIFSSSVSFRDSFSRRALLFTLNALGVFNFSIVLLMKYSIL